MKDIPKIIFSDFDGTLTHGHKIVPETLEVFSFCEEKNIPFVIVTGRSKSWAHFLLSHISSLEYVISEGGGVLSSVSQSATGRKIFDETLVGDIDIRRLQAMTEKLLDEFPETELSADSFGRQTDRAIELEWLNADLKRFEKIKEFLRKENINFSTSNVHLNFWCGDISKANAIKTFLKQKMRIAPKETLFFGDSLNDESVFKEFPSVGVSNISEVESQLVFRPGTVLLGEENEGPYGVIHYLKEILN